MTRYLDFVDLPAGLEKMVLMRLDLEQRRQARRELIVFFLVDTLSLGGLLASVVYLSNVFTQSGFGQYLSLLLTDSGSLLSYWQELALSLAESLPVLGFVSFLSIMAVLIWSIARTIINVRVLVN